MPLYQATDPIDPVLTTVSMTATANTWLRWTNNASSGTLTLPTAPPEGTVVVLENGSTGTTNAITVAVGGTDTWDWTAGTSYPIYPGEYVEATYRVSDSKWYTQRYFSQWNSSFNKTTVRRDSNGRTQMTDPLAALDVANKGYVDTHRLGGTGVSASQLIAASTITYITGSALPVPANPVAGDTYQFEALLSNAATIQTLTITPKIGINASIADTNVAPLTLAAGTAIVGSGHIFVTATIRVNGPSGVVLVETRFANNNAGTGISASTVLGAYATATVDLSVATNFGVSLTSTVSSVVSVQSAYWQPIRRQ